LARLGPPLVQLGRIDEGARLVDEAVSINRDLGYTFGLVESLHVQAGAAQEQGNLEKAEELLEESLAFAREIGDATWIGWDLKMLAYLAFLRDDSSRANDDSLATLSCLGALSVAAAKHGDWRRGGV